MKDYTFGLITGLVIGGCGGAAISYFVTKKRTKEKVEKEVRCECEDLIVDMRKYYEEKFAPRTTAVVKEDPTEIVKKYHDIASGYSDKDEYYDPADKESPSEDDEEGLDPEEIKAEMEVIKAYKYDEENRHRGPQRITPEEFGDAPGYEAKEITYYVEDSTYCDEFEEVIDDEVYLFGTAIDGWDTNHEDTDSLYIRNYQIQVDFKIDKMFCHCPQNPYQYEE